VARQSLTPVKAGRRRHSSSVSSSRLVNPLRTATREPPGLPDAFSGAIVVEVGRNPVLGSIAGAEPHGTSRFFCGWADTPFLPGYPLPVEAERGIVDLSSPKRIRHAVASLVAIDRNLGSPSVGRKCSSSMSAPACANGPGFRGLDSNGSQNQSVSSNLWTRASQSVVHRVVQAFSAPHRQARARAGGAQSRFDCLGTAWFRAAGYPAGDCHSDWFQIADLPTH
jgi:hypothetical protein